MQQKSSSSQLIRDKDVSYSVVKRLAVDVQTSFIDNNVVDDASNQYKHSPPKIPDINSNNNDSFQPFHAISTSQKLLSNLLQKLEFFSETYESCIGKDFEVPDSKLFTLKIQQDDLKLLLDNVTAMGFDDNDLDINNDDNNKINDMLTESADEVSTTIQSAKQLSRKRAELLLQSFRHFRNTQYKTKANTIMELRIQSGVEAMENRLLERENQIVKLRQEMDQFNQVLEMRAQGTVMTADVIRRVFEKAADDENKKLMALIENQESIALTMVEAKQKTAEKLAALRSAVRTVLEKRLEGISTAINTLQQLGSDGAKNRRIARQKSRLDVEANCVLAIADNARLVTTLRHIETRILDRQALQKSLKVNEEILTLQDTLVALQNDITRDQRKIAALENQLQNSNNNTNADKLTIATDGVGGAIEHKEEYDAIGKFMKNDSVRWAQRLEQGASISSPNSRNRSIQLVPIIQRGISSLSSPMSRPRTSVAFLVPSTDGNTSDANNKSTRTSFDYSGNDVGGARRSSVHSVMSNGSNTGNRRSSQGSVVNNIEYLSSTDDFSEVEARTSYNRNMNKLREVNVSRTIMTMNSVDPNLEMLLLASPQDGIKPDHFSNRSSTGSLTVLGGKKKEGATTMIIDDLPKNSSSLLHDDASNSNSTSPSRRGSTLGEGTSNTNKPNMVAAAGAMNVAVLIAMSNDRKKAKAGMKMLSAASDAKNKNAPLVVTPILTVAEMAENTDMKTSAVMKDFGLIDAYSQVNKILHLIDIQGQETLVPTELTSFRKVKSEIEEYKDKIGSTAEHFRELLAAYEKAQKDALFTAATRNNLWNKLLRILKGIRTGTRFKTAAEMELSALQLKLDNQKEVFESWSRKVEEKRQIVADLRIKLYRPASSKHSKVIPSSGTPATRTTTPSRSAMSASPRLDSQSESEKNNAPIPSIVPPTLAIARGSHFSRTYSRHSSNSNGTVDEDRDTSVEELYTTVGMIGRAASPRTGWVPESPKHISADNLAVRRRSSGGGAVPEGSVPLGAGIDESAGGSRRNSLTNPLVSPGGGSGSGRRGSMGWDKEIGNISQLALSDKGSMRNAIDMALRKMDREAGGTSVDIKVLSTEVSPLSAATVITDQTLSPGTVIPITFSITIDNHHQGGSSTSNTINDNANTSSTTDTSSLIHSPSWKPKKFTVAYDNRFIKRQPDILPGLTKLLLETHQPPSVQALLSTSRKNQKNPKEILNRLKKAKLRLRGEPASPIQTLITTPPIIDPIKQQHEFPSQPTPLTFPSPPLLQSSNKSPLHVSLPVPHSEASSRPISNEAIQNDNRINTNNITTNNEESEKSTTSNLDDSRNHPDSGSESNTTEKTLSASLSEEAYSNNLKNIINKVLTEEKEKKSESDTETPTGPPKFVMPLFTPVRPVFALSSSFPARPPGTLDHVRVTTTNINTNISTIKELPRNIFDDSKTGSNFHVTSLGPPPTLPLLRPSTPTKIGERGFLNKKIKYQPMSSSIPFNTIRQTLPTATLSAEKLEITEAFPEPVKLPQITQDTFVERVVVPSMTDSIQSSTATLVPKQGNSLFTEESNLLLVSPMNANTANQDDSVLSSNAPPKQNKSRAIRTGITKRDTRSKLLPFGNYPSSSEDESNLGGFELGNALQPAALTGSPTNNSKSKMKGLVRKNRQPILRTENPGTVAVVTSNDGEVPTADTTGTTISLEGFLPVVIPIRPPPLPTQPQPGMKVIGAVATSDPEKGKRRLSYEAPLQPLVIDQPKSATIIILDQTVVQQQQQPVDYLSTMRIGKTQEKKPLTATTELPLRATSPRSSLWNPLPFTNYDHPTEMKSPRISSQNRLAAVSSAASRKSNISDEQLGISPVIWASFDSSADDISHSPSLSEASNLDPLTPLFVPPVTGGKDKGKRSKPRHRRNSDTKNRNNNIFYHSELQAPKPPSFTKEISQQLVNEMLLLQQNKSKENSQTRSFAMESTGDSDITQSIPKRDLSITTRDQFEELLKEWAMQHGGEFMGDLSMSADLQQRASKGELLVRQVDLKELKESIDLHRKLNEEINLNANKSQHGLITDPSPPDQLTPGANHTPNKRPLIHISQRRSAHKDIVAGRPISVDGSTSNSPLTLTPTHVLPNKSKKRGSMDSFLTDTSGGV